MRFPMDFRWQNSGVQFRWGCMFAQILDCVCFGGNKTETLVAAFANISHFQKYISSILEKINSQSLEDTQVGYISQKYILDKNTSEKCTLKIYYLRTVRLNLRRYRGIQKILKSYRSTRICKFSRKKCRIYKFSRKKCRIYKFSRQKSRF